MSTRNARSLLRPLPLLVALVAVGLVIVGARFAARRRHPAVEVALETVSRRDIAQTVEATGTVEPIETVEIKSKASGQITEMPVSVGSVVRAGDLLVQVDPVNVRNDYDQAYAALKAAQASLDVSRAQARRAEALFSREALTADQHEAATLGLANAQSAFTRARASLSSAKKALDDATVRAPSAGTVIEQDVAKGQVITSATQSPSGGTTLLKMADLSRVQMNALVGETDIGSVHAGMPATVVVDAFPDRTFRGTVLKIEPQAVVQQSVTMFPVLVSIGNEEGLLLPGMNGEVTISISRRSGALAVPVDAIRSTRELPSASTALGLDADSVRAQVERQVAAARQAMRDSMRAHGGAGADPAARGFGRPGAGDGAAPDSARRARWMARMRAEGGGAGGDGPGMQERMARWRARRAAMGGDAPGGRGGFAGPPAGFGGGSAGGGPGASRAQAVLVKTGRGLEARVVRVGISDFDYTEIVSGLKEGDQVALLSVAEAEASRQSQKSQIRERMGSGMPGMGGAGGGRSGGGGRAGGGGR